MTRERISLERAYVLARRPYRDTSLLLEVFGEQHGRVGVVARGVRGGKSARSALLQPLRPLLLSWIESGDLGTLTGVEADGAPLLLTGERLICGWYLNELLTQLLQRHDPHAELFAAYATALQELVELPVEIPLRRFEMKLLSEAGYGLNLGGALEPGQHYRYDWASGPHLAEPGPATYSGASLRALRDGTLSVPEHLREARRLLREALRRQLAGRELKTPKLLRELRAAATGDNEP
jgi:DNA repair protein RecO (recombination protein O)